MTGVRSVGRAEFVAASPLWFLWAASTAPFFVLFFEFKCGDLGRCGAEWWYYARLYSHFFLYPVTFGFIATPVRWKGWSGGTACATLGASQLIWLSPRQALRRPSCKIAGGHRPQNLD